MVAADSDISEEQSLQSAFQTKVGYYRALTLHKQGVMGLKRFEGNTLYRCYIWLRTTLR